MKLSIYAMSVATMLSLMQTTLIAGSYEIPWHTVDCGGATSPGDSIGGSYAVAGTIGQPDATINPPLSGGTFELAGGFWPVPIACHCLGDLNHDSVKDGADIQLFVSCVLANGDCSCADMDAINAVTFNDVSIFVTDLLNGVGCP